MDGFSWTQFAEACRLPAWDQEDTVPREEDFECGDCRYEQIWRKISPVRPGGLLLLREKWRQKEEDRVYGRKSFILAMTKKKLLILRKIRYIKFQERDA